MPPTTTARPSTSSGPGSSKTAGSRPNFDKRLSKDDLALMTMGRGRTKGLQPYVTAVKGPGLLSPKHKPAKMRMASPPPISSLPSRMLTPESLGSGGVPIGMALGSPTRDSHPYAATPYAGSPQVGWTPQSQATVTSSSPPPSMQQTAEPPLPRTKTQKRRLFGSLFGSKKHAEQPKAKEVTGTDRGTASVTNEDHMPARSGTAAGRKTPKHKPITIKSGTQPQVEVTPPEPMTQRGPQYTDGWPSVSNSVPSIASSGLLGIEIPDIRLERYSVMFSGVLDPNGAKSSLLERRQATLEKLKTISDRIEQEGREKTKRRSTSPQPMKSPAFSLFPQTPRQSAMMTAAAMSSTTSLVPHRGLIRSNTSPALLPSPSRASFEPVPQKGTADQPLRKEKKTVTVVSPRTMDERNRAAQVEKLRQQQQQQAQQEQQYRPRAHTTAATATTSTTTAFQFSPNESGLILDSPRSTSFSSSSSEDESSDPPERPIGYTIPLKPTLPEPQWQMITPPSSTSTSTTSSADSASTNTTIASTKRPSSSSSSSSSSLTTRPSPSNSFDMSDSVRISVVEEDAALKAAVEISIARQISISRQQRQMLMRPLGRAGTVMTGTGGGASNRGGNGVERGRGRSATVGGGVARKQLGQVEEVMVGVVQGRVTPVMVGEGQGQGHRYKKSERAVLDVVE